MVARTKSDFETDPNDTNMVARTPPTQNNNMLPVFYPVLIRQTLNK
ncbi:hypothetical protein A2U01_0110261, partial [Trifolium medium]|nr:hypothetical protein [Trifolium medium]